MALVSNIKFHDYQFELPTSVGKWRWTTRLDVSLSAPTYSIKDVVSPYGLLRDSIPIPGDVVIAMSDSIAELKANFAPRILIGPPSSLAFTLDEGRGFSPPEDGLLTNNGVYGSLLSTTLTASQSYIRVTPATIGNLALNESGEFTVEVDSTTLLASGSPYAATVSVQDSTASNNPQTLPVTITVRPKATIAPTPLLLTFNAVRPLSGAFPSVPTQFFTLENSGPVGSVLNFEVKKLTGLSPWLTSFLPALGTLDSGITTDIVLTVVPPEGTAAGTYTETLRVIGYSTNSYVDVEIQLVIT